MRAADMMLSRERWVVVWMGELCRMVGALGWVGADTVAVCGFWSRLVDETI